MIERIQLMSMIFVVLVETAAGVGSELMEPEVEVEVEVEMEAVVAHWAPENLLTECWIMEVEVA
jgi:hypothetical protein